MTAVVVFLTGWVALSIAVGLFAARFIATAERRERLDLADYILSIPGEEWKR